MTHRQIMEALSGLLLGMFVRDPVLAPSSPTPCREIIGDLGGGQSRLHLGRHGLAAGDDRHHAHLGQARGPVQQEAAGPDSPRSSTWSARSWPVWRRPRAC